MDVCKRCGDPCIEDWQKMMCTQCVIEELDAEVNGRDPL